MGSWGKTGFPPEISGSFWDVFKRIGRRKKMNIFHGIPKDFGLESGISRHTYEFVQQELLLSHQ